MKIALCLYGKVGNNTKYALAPPTMDLANLGFDHWKKNLINHNDVDVFLHCWDKQFKEEIIKMYQPKGYIFQEQINFGKGLTTRQFAIKSSWYSRKRSVYIMSKYEEKYSFEYDAVILCRFDAALMREINIKEEKLNMEKFYVNGPFPVHNHEKLHSVCRRRCCDPESEYYEVHDLFYISNSKNMKSFSSAYDAIDSYGLVSNHIISRKHLQRTGLWEKMDNYLFLLAYNYNTWNSIEDGDITLVRWVYDVGGNRNENT
jgi:hypothetical protein